MTRHRPGFSLIEFTAVLALMALLAGIVSVSVHHIMVKGKQDAARAQIANLRTAVEQFYVDTGHYPTNDQGLAVLPPRIPLVPKDPWDHAYEYFCPGTSQPYEIVTRGGDGRRGGTGADADISSEDLRAGTSAAK